MSTSDLLAQDLVPILDSSKSLADNICQVALAARPSFVYSNHGIKAAQTAGGFSVLQLLSLPIAHTTNVLSGDTRQELDVTIADTSVIPIPSLNALFMLMSNSKVKEEMFRSNFPLADVQEFLAVYQNAMNISVSPNTL